MGGPDAVCQQLDTQHPDIHELVGERMFTEIPEDHFAWEAAKCVEERPLHLHTPRPHLRPILPGMMRGSGVNAGHAHCFGREKHISSCRAHLSYLHQCIGHWAVATLERGRTLRMTASRHCTLTACTKRTPMLPLVL